MTRTDPLKELHSVQNKAVDTRKRLSNILLLPSPHRLKPLDVEFMKRLHEKVNVIPLIAKADTLTPEECQQFKKQVSSFPRSALLRELQTLKRPVFSV